MRNPQRSPQLGEMAASEGLPIEVSVMDVDSDDRDGAPPVSSPTGG